MSTKPALSTIAQLEEIATSHVREYGPLRVSDPVRWAWLCLLVPFIGWLVFFLWAAELRTYSFVYEPAKGWYWTNGRYQLTTAEFVARDPRRIKLIADAMRARIYADISMRKELDAFLAEHEAIKLALAEAATARSEIENSLKTSIRSVARKASA